MRQYIQALEVVKVLKNASVSHVNEWKIVDPRQVEPEEDETTPTIQQPDTNMQGIFEANHR